MAREPINAGASTLAAMSDNVAKMGALRQQALAQTSESLNNAARHLQEWQKGYDERKRAKWVQDMETAKFDEQKRMNDINANLAQERLELEKTLAPHQIKFMNSQTSNYLANAGATNFGTQKARDDLNYLKEQEKKQAELDAERNKPNPTAQKLLDFGKALFGARVGGTPQTNKTANLNIGKPTSNYNTNGAMMNNPENTNATKQPTNWVNRQ